MVRRGAENCKKCTTCSGALPRLIITDNAAICNYASVRSVCLLLRTVVIDGVIFYKSKCLGVWSVSVLYLDRIGHGFDFVDDFLFPYLK